MNRRLLMTPLAAAIALATGTVATAVLQPAHAQIEEVIVTARARAESLQDVPASITAFTGADIERIGVERAEDFIGLTPGVSMVNTVEVGDTQVSIRGLNGARDAETNFAFILDGILYTNPSAFNREYTDLSQIEVLKGPQGALYGRSAAAGAIIVTTKKPGEETDMSFNMSIAEHGTFSAKGTVGGQIGENVYGRFSADYRETDGFLRNTFVNDDVVNNFENHSISGRLIWDVSESTTIDTKLRYAEVDAASIAFNAAFALPAFTGFLGPDAYIDVNDHQFVFTPNVVPENEQETLEFSIKLDHELENATLTSWLLYSDQEQYFLADGTSGAFGFYFGDQNCLSSTAALAGFPVQSPTFIGPEPGFSLYPPYSPTTCDGYQYQERNQEDVSFQMQLTSTNDGPLRWQTGFYLLDIDRTVGVAQLLDNGNPNRPRSFVNPLTDALVLDDFGTNVYAVFGSINYDVSDTVELSFALRYDREERDVSNRVPTPSQALSTRINYCGLTGAGFCSFDGVTPLNGTPLNPAFIDFNTGIVVDSIADREETFSELQPKISVTWDASDSLTWFSSYGIGFKSGGFNNIGATETIQFFFVNAGASVVAPPEAYREETSDAFELGFRYGGPSFDVNGAFFYTDVEDMQFFEFFVGPFGLLRVVSNIDEVEITGFELGLSADLTENFSIDAGFSIMDTEIKRNSIRPITVGNEAPNAPEYTFNFAAQYIMPGVFDGIDFVGRLEYSHTGETWFHTVQDDVVPATLFGGPPANFDRSKVEDYGIANIRLGLEAANWSVTAFSQNVTDEDYLAEVITAPEFGGSFVHPGVERTSGIEFSYRFR